MRKRLQLVRFTRRVGTDDTTFFKRGDTAQGRVTPEGSFRVMKGQWAACNLTVFAGYFTLVL